MWSTLGSVMVSIWWYDSQYLMVLWFIFTSKTDMLVDGLYLLVHAYIYGHVCGPIW